MRQRVGFARAIVTEPDALLMDEPFSALDVLTAENLRSELVRLWEGHGAPVKSILIVTHNIEEAVLLADRVLVLSSNPGRIRAELAVELPRPRDRHAPRLRGPGRHHLRHPHRPRGGRRRRARGRAGRPTQARRRPAARPRPRSNTPLPDVSPGGLAGLLEILVARGGKDGLAEIADDLSFEIDDLLPLIDAAVLLRHGPHRRLRHRAHRRGQGVRRRRHPHQQAAVRRGRRRARAAGPRHRPGARAPPRTTPCARGSSSTCCAAASPPTRPAASSTPPSTGAATPSCSTTTATTRSSPWSPVRPITCKDPTTAAGCTAPGRYRPAASRVRSRW